MHFVLAAELRGDAVHFGLSLRDGDARVQLAEDGESCQVAGKIVVGDLHWAPQLGIAQQKRFGGKQEMEVARQDADDGDVLLVVAQHLADDVDVATETALPETVAQDHHVRTVQDGFFGEEVASEDRVHPKDGEEVGGDEADGHLLRALVTFGGAEVDGGAASTGGGGELLKGAAALLIIAKVGRGNGGQRLAAGAVIVPDGGQAIGLEVGKRAQEHGVNHGEHSGIGADAEREGQDGDYGEAGSFGEQTKGVANVGDESIHGLTPGLYAGIDVENSAAFPVGLRARNEPGWRLFQGRDYHQGSSDRVTGESIRYLYGRNLRY